MSGVVTDGNGILSYSKYLAFFPDWLRWLWGIYKVGALLNSTAARQREVSLFITSTTDGIVPKAIRLTGIFLLKTWNDNTVGKWPNVAVARMPFPVVFVVVTNATKPSGAVGCLDCSTLQEIEWSHLLHNVFCSRCYRRFFKLRLLSRYYTYYIVPSSLLDFVPSLSHQLPTTIVWTGDQCNYRYSKILTTKLTCNSERHDEPDRLSFCFPFCRPTLVANMLVLQS